MSQGNVSDWFNRPGYRPSIDALKRISETYNVNLNWLITGEGEMFNNVRTREGDNLLHDVSGFSRAPHLLSALLLQVSPSPLL